MAGEGRGSRGCGYQAEFQIHSEVKLFRIKISSASVRMITVVRGEIGSVDEFMYLGSVIAVSGRMDTDVDNRVAKASRAFGALRKAVFLDRDLSLCMHQEDDLPGFCHVSIVVWCRVLDPTQEAYQEIEHIPPQMYQDHTGNLQQSPVG